MNDQDTIAISRSVISAAAQRAKQSGLSTEDFVTQVLLRELEVDPEDRVILAYDAVGSNEEFAIDRVERETDQQYETRAAALKMLFP